jgi:hypothetical protein
MASTAPHLVRPMPRLLTLLPGPAHVGLTDEAVEGPVPDVAVASDAEIDFLLEVLGGVFEEPVRREDIVGTYAGLRALLHADGRTADLSRRHAVLRSSDGVVTVVGGKLTTNRRMAQDAIDAVLAGGMLTAGPCRMHRLPHAGAVGRDKLAELRAPRRLVRRYGTESTLLAGDPETQRPVVDGLPWTMAELVWGVTQEGALDVDDLLDRRTRTGLVPADRERAVTAARDALAGRLTPARPLRGCSLAATLSSMTDPELDVQLEAFRHCVIDRDAVAAEAVLDADFALVLIQPVPALMPRASWLAVLGEYVVHEWVVEEERLDLDGDDCAAHLQRVRMRATVLGEDRSGPFVISDVWRRRPEGWRVWRRHSTPLSAGTRPGATAENERLI